jgi:hypothetical protein
MYVICMISRSLGEGSYTSSSSITVIIMFTCFLGLTNNYLYSTGDTRSLPPPPQMELCIHMYTYIHVHVRKWVDETLRTETWSTIAHCVHTVTSVPLVSTYRTSSKTVKYMYLLTKFKGWWWELGCHNCMPQNGSEIFNIGHIQRI